MVRRNSRVFEVAKGPVVMADPRFRQSASFPGSKGRVGNPLIGVCGVSYQLIERWAGNGGRSSHLVNSGRCRRTG